MKTKKFIDPEATLIIFPTEDVIVTSVIGSVDEDDPIEQPQGN